MVVIHMRNTAELDLTYRTAVALSLEHHLELPRSKAVPAITDAGQELWVAIPTSAPTVFRLGISLGILLAPLSLRLVQPFAVRSVIGAHVGVSFLSGAVVLRSNPLKLICPLRFAAVIATASTPVVSGPSAMPCFRNSHACAFRVP